MSKNTLLRRGSLLVVAGTIGLAVACGGDTPTDVAVPTLQAGPPTTAAFAASGKPSTSTYEMKSFGFDVAPNFQGIVEVLCPVGKRALGGGHKIDGGAPNAGPDVAVYESTPRVTSGTDGWRVEAMNRTADTRRIEAWVICAAI